MRKILFNVLAVALSGGLWYLAGDISGDFGYLMWIAPVPVLYASFGTRRPGAFLMGFMALFIGRMSWFSYLASIMPPGVVLAILAIIAFIGAIILLLSRWLVISGRRWYAVFAFPALFTLFEFALLRMAPDGTAGSIAYSQMNYLPVIQVASLTGLPGITFLLTLVPSAIAVAWYYKRAGQNVHRMAFAAGAFVVPAFVFGFVRLGTARDIPVIRVGAISLDESFHHVTQHPDIQQEYITVAAYAKVIAGLDVQLVVLPERAINIIPANQDSIFALLENVARENHTAIVLGYTNYRTDTTRNSSLVIDPSGHVVMQYDKHRLIKVLEDQFTPGNHIGLFDFKGMPFGTAVCKDLDFPDYIRRYRTAAVLAVPAWDFKVDGWLHSRMAILRGVEEGFSEVRAARRGRLTISDAYGRVLAEADCGNLKTTTLVGNVPLNKKHTVYARFGDWFGFLDLVAVVWLIGFGASAPLRKWRSHSHR